MSSSTIRLYVYADTYSEILEQAELELCKFLGIDSAQERGINYELNIRPSDPDDNAADGYAFTAELIARVKK